MKFETKVIHAGQEPDAQTGAVMTPIYATSTYAQSSPGAHKGYDYARTRNPTRDALEACLAELESGHAGFAFASGMAAIGTVLDLQAVAAIARKRGLLAACDNTFASPWIQRPLEHGFDIVVHSTTKYINGHSDVIGGAAIIRQDEALKEKLAFLQNAVGGVPSPFDAFLTLRGIKTLALRMERHCANALEVARFLQSHAKVQKVFYPGLESHPQHALAK